MPRYSDGPMVDPMGRLLRKATFSASDLKPCSRFDGGVPACQLAQSPGSINTGDTQPRYECVQLRSIVTVNSSKQSAV